MGARQGWSSDGLRLDAGRIAEAYARVRPDLVRDPLLIADAAAYDVGVDALDKRMSAPPQDLTADTFWGWLNGADQYRWAGLRVLAEAYATSGTEHRTGRVVVPEGTMRIARGDVRVDGDLVLEDQAMVLVLGTLTVTGALVALPDYTMVAAAEAVCRDGVSAGEVLALGAVRCPGTLYLAHGDHSCRAPLCAGGTLVDFERDNAFGAVDVAERITDWDFAAAARALGLPEDVDDLRDAYAARLLGS
ncbi:hypothetical protein ACF1BP_11455 [Streptomyces sp. NPDC014735]|uniref:hypothetical protein n=1 Tax=unclassified Streptomyces TaxID=2593676 RepID=UPI0037015433